MTITVNERLFMALIDTLVWLNRHTVRVNTEDHNCESSGIKCHMLERECGAPWHTLLIERRHKRQSS
jgi:uncharacterized protein YqkB